MVIVCHSCGTRYKLPENALEKGARKTKCRKCSATMLILPPDGDSDSWPDEIMTAAVEQVQAEEARQEEPQERERVSSDDETVAGDDSEAPDTQEAESGQAAAEESPDSEVPEEGPDVKPDEDEEASGKVEQPEVEEDPEAKAEAELEKRRRQMEADIAGRLSKAALETLDLKDLESIADKIQEIESNTQFEISEKEALYACLNCITVYSVFPNDKKVCSTCSTDAEVNLVPASEIMRQYGMFRRI